MTSRCVPDPLESAISFAASLIRKGDYMGKAIKIAAGYYKVEYADVQKGLSRRSGKSRKGKKINKPFRYCDYCSNSLSGKEKQEATVRYRAVEPGYVGSYSFFLCEKCDKEGRIGEVLEWSEIKHYDLKRTKYIANKPPNQRRSGDETAS